MRRRAVGARKAGERAVAVLERQGATKPPIPVGEICEDLGLVVVYQALPNDTSSVLIRQPDGRQVIGVNARHAPRRRRFSLAHELGHALLHFPPEPPGAEEAVVSRPLEVLFRDGIAGQGTDAVEIDANTFAAELLMPGSLVRANLRKLWSQDFTRRLEDVVEDLADEFDVSSQAMRYRLVNLGLADPV
jgi:Zn-dependent peptidase ImmA (M78 family)